MNRGKIGVGKKREKGVQRGREGNDRVIREKVG